LKISYVQHENIDKEKWDRCIENAANGLIYARSYFLDIMSKNWGALVMNDYEAVMPLTWNRKFGIFYLRQPAFTQQLGIFGNFSINNDVAEEFINKALELFSFAEINLNFANEYKRAAAIRCNLILSLNRPFIEIENNFRKDFVKKIKDNNLIFEVSDEAEKAILLFKQTYSKKLHTSESGYENLIQLCLVLTNKGQLLVRKVSSQDGKLLAIAIFFKDKKRIYYILSTTLPEGRKLDANYFLLYHLIKEFSEQNLIFDFEGSEIPSINFFFRKFGAIEQPYPFVRINQLPVWKKWIKKIYDYYKFRSKESRI